MTCRAKVLLSHPGTQHSQQTALGLQKAGILDKFITGFYYHPDGLLASILKFFPAGIRGGIERELLRRRKTILDIRKIRILPLSETFYVFASRLDPSNPWRDTLIPLRNKTFDSAVSQIISNDPPNAVMAFDDAACRTFEAAGNVGTGTILDIPIGHIRSGERLFREEAEMHPDFADSLPREFPRDVFLRTDREKNLADTIVTGSEYSAKTLIENGVSPNKIFVIPYGVNLEAFKPAEEKDSGKFRILFVGQVGQRKGIKYLLEAFKRLRLPDAELLIIGSVVGDGKGLIPYRGFFTQISGVPHTEVRAYFQSADLFVFPSLHEGSALVTYEALAAGVPVITTPNAGSVVRDGTDGFIVPIRNVEAIMEKIEVLYKNIDLRKNLAQNARQRAEQFSWNHYHQRLAGLVSDFLAKRPDR